MLIDAFGHVFHWCFAYIRISDGGLRALNAQKPIGKMRKTCRTVDLYDTGSFHKACHDHDCIICRVGYRLVTVFAGLENACASLPMYSMHVPIIVHALGARQKSKKSSGPMRFTSDRVEVFVRSLLDALVSG